MRREENVTRIDQTIFVDSLLFSGRTRIEETAALCWFKLTDYLYNLKPTKPKFTGWILAG